MVPTGPFFFSLSFNFRKLAVTWVFTQHYTPVFGGDDSVITIDGPHNEAHGARDPDEGRNNIIVSLRTFFRHEDAWNILLGGSRGAMCKEGDGLMTGLVISPKHALPHERRRHGTGVFLGR